MDLARFLYNFDDTLNDTNDSNTIQLYGEHRHHAALQHRLYDGHDILYTHHVITMRGNANFSSKRVQMIRHGHTEYQLLIIAHLLPIELINQVLYAGTRGRANDLNLFKCMVAGIEALLPILGTVLMILYFED
tara:strand:- start:282 stop:680 length:399 start_codon:yes stop_codon:yes gene_type:complete